MLSSKNRIKNHKCLTTILSVIQGSKEQGLKQIIVLILN